MELTSTIGIAHIIFHSDCLQYNSDIGVNHSPERGKSISE